MRGRRGDGGEGEGGGGGGGFPTDAPTRPDPPHPLSLSPLFVTWNVASPPSPPRLRGCIGSLDPRPLRSGLARYALASALSDGRFPPVARRELPTLACTVSLLAGFEDAAHVHDWEAGRHGVVLRYEDNAGVPRSATYLPAVAREQGWTVPQAIDSLFVKAGHVGPVTDEMRREARLTRYVATTATIGHREWRDGRAGEGAGGGGRA